MTITFIRWKDACSEEAAEPNTPVSDDPLYELCEVGWLIGETADSVSIGLEVDPEGRPSRWRLHIPKANIVERRDLELEKFPKRKKR